MARSLTTFANQFGAWTWDSEATLALRFPDGTRIETLAAFIRGINEQRQLHRLIGQPYSVTQELLPQGGATP